MKKEFLILILLITVISSSHTNSTNTLEIYINNIRNNNGLIYLNLMDESKKTVKVMKCSILNNSCKIFIPNLEKGNYAFRFFHDENNNKKIDTNILGVPKEGFGFSNTTQIPFGLPNFRKTLFNFKNSTTLKTEPKYL